MACGRGEEPGGRLCRDTGRSTSPKSGAEGDQEQTFGQCALIVGSMLRLCENTLRASKSRSISSIVRIGLRRPFEAIITIRDALPLRAGLLSAGMATSGRFFVLTQSLLEADAAFAKPLVRKSLLI